jgi:hypothetical protein
LGDRRARHAVGRSAGGLGLVPRLTGPPFEHRVVVYNRWLAGRFGGDRGLLECMCS